MEMRSHASFVRYIVIKQMNFQIHHAPSRNIFYFHLSANRAGMHSWINDPSPRYFAWRISEKYVIYFILDPPSRGNENPAAGWKRGKDKTKRKAQIRVSNKGNWWTSIDKVRARAPQKRRDRLYANDVRHSYGFVSCVSYVHNPRRWL